jgi:predicted DNA-binding transcriptional regulator YafY
MTKRSTESRLDRLERLQGVLRGGGPDTAGDLATALGVSLRTVWRDLAVLRAGGVPIDSDRGRGGGVRLQVRWSLGRLNLTEEEAIDLLLSMAIAEKLDSPLLLNRLRFVRQKLTAAYSDTQQGQIRALRKRILLGGPASKRVAESNRAPSPAILAFVKAAFFEMRRLRITYVDEAEQVTVREIEPQFLYLNVPVWYLLAWDHLRDGVRFFRVDRLRQVEKLDSTFRARETRLFLSDTEPDARDL